MREWLMRPILALNTLLQVVQVKGQSDGTDVTCPAHRTLFFLSRVWIEDSPDLSRTFVSGTLSSHLMWRIFFRLLM